MPNVKLRENMNATTPEGDVVYIWSINGDYATCHPCDQNTGATLRSVASLSWALSQLTPWFQEPVVGMGATLSVGSDAYPYTVIEVRSKTTLVARRDNYRRIDKNGYGGNQEYEFTPNPTATPEIFTFRRNGRWIRKGSSMRGSPLRLGKRNAYSDPHF